MTTPENFDETTKTISLLFLFTTYFIINVVCYPLVASKEEITNNGPIPPTFMLLIAWLLFVWYVGVTPPIF